jgi:hypothetical protein
MTIEEALTDVVHTNRLNKIAERSMSINDLAGEMK